MVLFTMQMDQLVKITGLKCMHNVVSLIILLYHHLKYRLNDVIIFDKCRYFGSPYSLKIYYWR